ncbi:hypothetical protein QRY07_12040 [Bacillus cereus]|uniref:hypothetical protein n=1 Tax=Bacillus cereus TaxID=1396 RepID=UPI00256FD7C4|nr:hypothetical protein [Bacillus cereus]WJE22416.1 hypothetical protein QRY07_12040 [Bacillus cereus]
MESRLKKERRKNTEKEKGAKTIPLLRYYQVFNMNTQVIGLESKLPPRKEHEPIKEAKAVLEGYLTRDGAPKYKHHVGDAQLLIVFICHS